MYLQTKEVDYRPAERRLELWLKKQGLGALHTSEWARWDFNNRPFWSVWALVVGEKVIAETWGLQIYDDGEVSMVTKLGWIESKWGGINEQNV